MCLVSVNKITHKNANVIGGGMNPLIVNNLKGKMKEMQPDGATCRALLMPCLFSNNHKVKI